MRVDPNIGLRPAPLRLGEAGRGLARLRSASGPDGLHHAARAFESLLVSQLMRSMRSTVQQSELLGGGMDADLFTEMLDGELARAVAERGLGLADMLERGLGGAEWHWPPAEGPVSSPYGMRLHPITGERRFHHGVDIAAPMAAPVRAVVGGEVVFSGRRGGFGELVEVRGEEGRSFLYAHLSRRDVAVGDRVRAGQVVAGVGRSGAATGPHLHFEVRSAGRSLDPASLAPKKGSRPLLAAR